MCHNDNNPTEEQKTTEGQQWVFNTAIEKITHPEAELPVGP